MIEQTKTLADYWPKIDSLIAAAKEDPALRDKLQYGTPDQKRGVLNDFGLSFDDLVFIHRELATVVYQGSLRFWWW